METGDQDMRDLKRPRHDPSDTPTPHPPPAHQPVRQALHSDAPHPAHHQQPHQSPRLTLPSISHHPPTAAPPNSTPHSAPHTYGPARTQLPPTTPVDQRQEFPRGPQDSHPYGPRPDHGPPVNPAQRSYSVDAAYARGPGTPAQSAPFERPRPLAISASHEGAPPMDHARHHPYHGPEHPMNGHPPPNGLPLPAHHEQYGPPTHMGPPPPGYVPQSPSPYNQMGGHYGPAQGDYGQLRQQPQQKRQVRALQACNSCRQRKQKCDEGKPACSSCVENNIECLYKEVPLPKQDRTTKELTDQMAKVIETVGTLASEFTSFKDEVRGYYDLKIPRRKVSVSAPVSPKNYQEDPDTDMAGNLDSLKKSPDQNSLPAIPGSMNPPPPSLPNRQWTVAHTAAGAEPDRFEESGVSLPAGHSTAPHSFLYEWQSLKHIFAPYLNWLEENGQKYDPYAIESKRGIIRVWGVGEGSDAKDGSAPSPASDSNAPSPPSADHGYGLYPVPPDTRIHRSDLDGGMTPEGVLKLDEATVIDLFTVYKRRMHPLQPFLDLGALEKTRDKFIKENSPSGPPPTPPLRPGFVPAEHLLGKRKRSEDTAAELRKPPARSIGNALLLLIMALGKICRWTDPKLPTPAGDAELQSLSAAVFRHGTDSPPATARRSPASTHSIVPGASPSAYDSMRQFPSSRRGSREWGPRPIYDREWNHYNTERIPGFAYFAYASDILGNHHGGHEISHVQARLLACLYMSQLGRVVDSWAWVHHACISCHVLVRQNLAHLGPREKDDPRPSPSIELIKYAYWTCVQLESDIIAELSDAPLSGITQHDDKVSKPEGVYDDMLSVTNEEPNIVYYTSQITLRKFLNAAHSELYGKKMRSRLNMTSADPAAKILEEDLEEWRKLLSGPTQVQLVWDDSEEPATDINAARLRAKYYGAKYIVTRPLLEYALHRMKQRPDLLNDMVQHSSPATTTGSVPTSTPGSSDFARQGWSDERQDKQDRNIIEGCRRCIEAARQSTIAFDRIRDHGRLVVTNIFGTAQAQFGNILVLTAVRMSWLKPLITLSEYNSLCKRTIQFMGELESISPTMRVNKKILEYGYEQANKHSNDVYPASTPAHSSSSSAS